MKEIIDEYGSTIVTIAVAAITVVLLGGLTIGNATGIIDIFGNNAEKLADTDIADTQSASVTVLNAQAAETVPELKVKANATVNKAITLNDLFEVTNNVKDMDLSVSEITTTLNDSSTDAVSQGLVNISGTKNLTFTMPGEYYLTLDIRTPNRVVTRTFKVTAVSEPEYIFEKINGSWCFVKKEFDYVTRKESETVIQKYPVSHRIKILDGPPTRRDVGSYEKLYAYYDETKQKLYVSDYNYYCTGFYISNYEAWRNGANPTYSIDGHDSYTNKSYFSAAQLNKETGLPKWWNPDVDVIEN